DGPFRDIFMAVAGNVPAGKENGMAARKKTDGYPREGRKLGSLGHATITGVCEWEPPEGSRMRPAPHGTAARYAQAQRVGAPRCQDCKDAHTAADLEYRRGRRAGSVLRARLSAD